MALPGERMKKRMSIRRKSAERTLDYPTGLDANICARKIVKLLQAGYDVRFRGFTTTRCCRVSIFKDDELVTHTVCQMEFFDNGLSDVYNQVPEMREKADDAS